MRLLWVENHPVFVRMVRQKFLAEQNVAVVPSIAAARQALGDQDFDVVLVDYDLDDGKGTDLIDFIQRLPRRPVVVATSAHAAGNESLLLAGADAVCSKLRFAEIETVLRGLGLGNG